jgi:hypothetical protein
VVDFNRHFLDHKKIKFDNSVRVEVVFFGGRRRRLRALDARLRFLTQSNHRPILGTALAPILAGRNNNALGAKKKEREL